MRAASLLLIAELRVNSRNEILPTYRVIDPSVCAPTSSVVPTHYEPHRKNSPMEPYAPMPGAGPFAASMNLFTALVAELQAPEAAGLTACELEAYSGESPELNGYLQPTRRRNSGLCQTLLAATGFTNKNLRVLTAGLPGSAYTPGQMTYDLRRLRLNGLIRWLPHTNRYVLTADSVRIAVFYTKVYNRLLVPLTAANQAQAPPELRAALAAITRHVDDYANRARLPRAA